MTVLPWKAPLRLMMRRLPGVREEYLAGGQRRDRSDLVHEVDAGLVGTMIEGMIVGQPAELVAGHGGQPRIVEAQRCRPQARHPFHVAPAGVVAHIHALAAGDDQRAFLLVTPRICLRMQMQFHIDGARRVVKHAVFPAVLAIAIAAQSSIL
jgi:hypothetical protein